MKEENIIFKSIICRKVLLELSKNKVSYGYKIAMDTKTTYCSVNKLIQKLKDLNLIRRLERQGTRNHMKYKSKRTHYYKLTRYGLKIVDLLIQIEEELKEAS